MTATYRRTLRDRFREVLLTAAEQRDKRRGIADTKHGPVCEWIANSQAGGHVDYANKVSLYCAEIALGIERTVY